MRHVRVAARSGSLNAFGLPLISPWKRLIAISALLSVLPVFFASAEPVAKNVLILHNWVGLPPSWSPMESTVRARISGPVNFYTASVENPRFYEKAYRESLADTLQRGYSGVKLDAIVASSYVVLQFTEEFRDKMFPGVPVVFVDVTSTQAQNMLLAGVTGVASTTGVKETIDLALRLQPDTKTFAIITGESEWDKHWLAITHSELLRYRDRVQEIDLIGPSDRELLKRVAGLPHHTVVLFQLRPDDSTDPAVDPVDILTAVAQSVPTYSAWPALALNHGGIGGAYRNLLKDAVLNGEVVAKVLSGQRPDNIPIVYDSDLQVQVDWPALNHWHIPESALPLGTQIQRRPISFWQHYRTYLIFFIILLVVQALVIAALLTQRARKREAETVLRESEERFRVMADATPALVWMCDARGKIAYLNDRWFSFTGAEPGAGLGDTWINYVHPDDVADVLSTFTRALMDRQSFSNELRLNRSDGTCRWMFNVASPRVTGDGSFAGFIGSTIDVTDQKLAQQALEKVSGQLIEAQEQERARIARDLHDDICQRLVLLSMELEQTSRSSNQLPDPTRVSLEDIRTHCAEIAGDVQALSHKLYSSKLEYLGVVAAIRSFCQEFSKQHEVAIEFTSNGVPQQLPKDISLCLFRVAQEALHNAVKYSTVRQFAVELIAARDQIQLVVSDSGAGFEVQEAMRSRGLGLISMQERVHLVRGTLSIESRPGRGTRIEAVIPLAPSTCSSFELGPTGKIVNVAEVA